MHDIDHQPKRLIWCNVFCPPIPPAWQWWLVEHILATLPRWNISTMKSWHKELGWIINANVSSLTIGRWYNFSICLNSCQTMICICLCICLYLLTHTGSFRFLPVVVATMHPRGSRIRCGVCRRIPKWENGFLMFLMGADYVTNLVIVSGGSHYDSSPSYLRKSKARNCHVMQVQLVSGYTWCLKGMSGHSSPLWYSSCFPLSLWPRWLFASTTHSLTLCLNLLKKLLLYPLDAHFHPFLYSCIVASPILYLVLHSIHLHSFLHPWGPPKLYPSICVCTSLCCVAP